MFTLPMKKTYNLENSFSQNETAIFTQAQRCYEILLWDGWGVLNAKTEDKVTHISNGQVTVISSSYLVWSRETIVYDLPYDKNDTTSVS